METQQIHEPSFFVSVSDSYYRGCTWLLLQFREWFCRQKQTKPSIGFLSKFPMSTVCVWTGICLVILFPQRGGSSFTPTSSLKSAKRNKDHKNAKQSERDSLDLIRRNLWQTEWSPRDHLFRISTGELRWCPPGDFTLCHELNMQTNKVKVQLNVKLSCEILLAT